MATGVDATYNVLNYREQGGGRDVIGGELDIVSGGSADFESGSALRLASGSLFQAAAGSVQTVGVAALTTAAASVGFGHYTAKSTSGAKSMSVSGPAYAGQRMSVACTAATTANTVTVSFGRQVGFTAAKTKVRFTGTGSLSLVSRTTAIWDLAGAAYNSSKVALSS